MNTDTTPERGDEQRHIIDELAAIRTLLRAIHDNVSDMHKLVRLTLTRDEENT